MALKAYIFINIGSKNVTKVLTKLREVKGVRSAEAVTGPYDIIVKAETEDMDAMGELVTQNILTIEGIDRTLSSIVLNL